MQHAQEATGRMRASKPKVPNWEIKSGLAPTSHPIRNNSNHTDQVVSRPTALNGWRRST